MDRVRELLVIVRITGTQHVVSENRIAMTDAGASWVVGLPFIKAREDLQEFTLEFYPTSERVE
jgi:hypothetical protein